MAAWVDFDTVIQSVNFDQLFRHYKLLAEDFVATSEEIRIPCPFEEQPKGTTLHANTTRKVFQCFRCKKSGDLLTFVVLSERIATGDRNQDRRRAALLLQEWFSIPSKRPKERPKREGPQCMADAPEPLPAGEGAEASDAALPDRNPPLSFPGLKGLDAAHPYLAEQGLSEATIAQFGIGYCKSGMMKDRIAIPIHDAEGVLVGYAGRYPGTPPSGVPPYLFPPGFHKSLILYNLHRAREHAGEGLIITEDFFTLFALYERGRQNVVSTMGASLSPMQERLVVETVGRRGKVLICFGAHESGERGRVDAVMRLAPQVFVRTTALPV